VLGRIWDLRGWRKLHNEELNNLNFLPAGGQINDIEIGETLA
jgi:hypothetical protein